MIKIKRIYEIPSKEDGYRVLVDRLWPRGVAKDKAKIDLWLEEIAPSTELRKWFGHDPAKWNEFRKKYHIELEKKQDLIQQLMEKSRKTNITLLYGAKDKDHNQALVLAEFLERLS